MAYVRSHGGRRGVTPAATLVGTPVGEFAAVAVVLAAGLVLTSTLAFGAGPGATLAALLAFAGSALVAGRGMHIHYPHDRLGLCNAITLARLAMAASLVAPLLAGAAPSWAVFTVAAIALSLDGIDGWLARRQGFVSGFGARFDMEVDSVLALLLATSAAVSSGFGPLAILLGLPRYAFAVATWFLPWMRRDLPERFSRKVVCVIQLTALIALQLPVLPMSLGAALIAVATLALVWSFWVDVRWLWRRRT